ncbi:Zinc finger MYM-type protein 1 [Orchesella cincta]|uniref:Zinc finger MYM-type protein 1 n=1 Tax=Orchesella cincta TaxID=48709 RepID=A0A1D2M4A2_ORCCI|nr:Zinc finger MYM-type protein 1 [Orchesella cincta]
MSEAKKQKTLDFWVNPSSHSRTNLNHSPDERVDKPSTSSSCDVEIPVFDKTDWSKTASGSNDLPTENECTWNWCDVLALNAPHHEIQVAPQIYQNRSFNFQLKWYNLYSWMHYDDTIKRIFCFYCLKANAKGIFSTSAKQEGVFTVTGFCNWKNGSSALKKHDESGLTKEAIIKLACFDSSPILNQLHTSVNKTQNQAKTSLKAIFTTIMFLAKQGLPLRGSDKDSGNFISLLKLRASDISELQSWLQRPRSFTSGEIQNEILEIIAHSILRKIRGFIQDAKLYSIVVDETSDCSVKEQVSLSVRIASNNLEVEEYFLGHYATESTTGECLTKVILDSLQRFGLSLENLRGQCFDGAANMSGCFRGVQARIKSLQPKALYVHCFNHGLNLALQDTITKTPFFP